MWLFGLQLLPRVRTFILIQSETSAISLTWHSELALSQNSTTQIRGSDQILQLHLSLLTSVSGSAHPGPSHISPLVQARWELEEFHRINDDGNILRWITLRRSMGKICSSFYLEAISAIIGYNLITRSRRWHENFAITEQHFTSGLLLLLFLSQH